MSTILVDNILGSTGSTVTINDTLILGNVGSTTPVKSLAIDAIGSVVIAAPIINIWESGSTGSYSVKISNDSTVDAIGNYSIAEGYSTTALGDYSRTQNRNTIANGDSAHAEGYKTTANGSASHSENYDTKALGLYSHAGGSGSTANGDVSFVHSINSNVTGNRSAIIGGSNITGSADDTVYTPKMETVLPGEGIIMASPDGTRYKVTVANGGTISIVLA